MIKAGKALKIILNAAKQLESENIHAGSDIPGFDNSVIDGYAVRFSDSP